MPVAADGRGGRSFSAPINKHRRSHSWEFFYIIRKSTLQSSNIDAPNCAAINHRQIYTTHIKESACNSAERYPTEALMCVSHVSFTHTNQSSHQQHIRTLPSPTTHETKGVLECFGAAVYHPSLSRGTVLCFDGLVRPTCVLRSMHSV